MLRIGGLQGQPMPGGPPPPQGGPGAPPPGMPSPGAGGPPPGMPPALAALMAAKGGPPSPGAPPPSSGGDDADPSKPSGRYDAQKTTQPISGYMGPENGPFACGHCIHFEAPGSCALVSGKIDAAGCCNLFEPGDNQGPDQGTDPNDADPEISGPGGQS